jgi:hypothetical protein
MVVCKLFTQMVGFLLLALIWHSQQRPSVHGDLERGSSCTQGSKDRRWHYAELHSASLTLILMVR